MEMSVAILHDVIEDSEITVTDLLSEGIPAVVDAVELLTKVDNESYDQFIGRVRKSGLASKIKRADIEDNINILRLESVGEDGLHRIAKYHSAWRQLNDGL